MEKLILIKYGELTTKKGNRNFFISTLRKNIQDKLKDYNTGILDDYYRMFIYVEENDIESIVEILKSIYGIHEINIAIKSEDKELDVIKEISINALKTLEFKTFKVETNRSDRRYPIKSMDLNRELGGYILSNIEGIKVDVHNPDIKLDIEIRQEAVYIYYEKIKGLGGYPVGTLGRGLLMLSGGIDSPVAGYLTLKRGVKLDYIYFESIPHTSIEARNKVIELANIINKYNSNSKLYVVNFTKIQETIYKELKSEYLITIMRRMMYKIAERLAKKINALAIINGESIGQVASQTLKSIIAVNDVTNYPILRPLCSFDKQEIINISKNIGTYETSILPYEDCCTVFVPKHPVINPNLKTVYEEEEKIDFLPLIEEALENINIIKLYESEQNSEYL